MAKKIQNAFSAIIIAYCLLHMSVIQAAVSASNLFISDVTPTSFNVIWVLSEASREAIVKVYTEPTMDSVEITDTLTIENLVDISASTLEQQALANGVMRVRVSGLHADTAYFIQAIASPAEPGADDLTPSINPLIPVHTQKISKTVSNDTFMISVLNTVDNGSTPADGSMLLMSLQDSPYPVSAMVGEVASSGQALINASNFYNANGNNRQLIEGELLTVVALGGEKGRAKLETTVPTNNKLGELKIIDPATIQLQVETDSDTDGIPDWYEAEHNLTNSDGDADSDTLSDLLEYLLGCNPNSNHSDSDGISDGDEYAAQISITSVDTDLDGINDNQESAYETNPLDSDSDDDGVSDGEEIAAGTDPLDDTSVPVIDIDNDGVDDQIDNCPGIYNPEEPVDPLYPEITEQPNLDRDLMGDACDNDIDGDGILNVDDNAPYHENLDQVDTDQDGVGDIGDNCPVDYNPVQTDTDEDGLGNECDADDDGDGINDYQTPIVPSDAPFKLTKVLSLVGTTLNVNYNENAAIGIYKYVPLRSFGDKYVLLGIIKMSNLEWIPEALTGADLTDEGALSIQVDLYQCGCFSTNIDETITLQTDQGEITAHLPAIRSQDLWSLMNVSSDGSTYTYYTVEVQTVLGMPVIIETLSGLVQSAYYKIPLDNCRLISNSDPEHLDDDGNQLDTDGDGMGDVCDISPEDLDGDGVLNIIESNVPDIVDNCPEIHNPSQTDLDADNIGDACDTDIDGDGIQNIDETLLYTDPLLIDTDGDGISDADEDSDFDGLSNLYELTNGSSPAIANGSYSKGMNLFHYPFSTPSGMTAYDLLIELGGSSVVTSVQRNNPAIGKLETAEYNGTVLQGVDFPVVAGEGYILQSNQAFAKTFNASIQCNDINLTQGLSMISLSCFPHGFSAYDLLEHMGGSSIVSSIQRFNPVTGLFETATFLNGSPVGVDFNLSNTEAYLVHAKQVAIVESPISAPVIQSLSLVDGVIINESETIIIGTVTNASDVVTINGQIASMNGTTFSLALGFLEGRNVITVLVRSANNLSTTQVLTVTLELPPIISIESHTDNQVIHQYDTVIFGSTAKPVEEVRINGDLAILTSPTTFKYGAFTCDMGQMGSTCTTSEPRIDLIDGANSITIEAIGLDGLNDTKVLILNRSPLEINAVNPGVKDTNFSILLPLDVSNNIASHAVTVPSATDYLSGINRFNSPFYGKLQAKGSITKSNNRIDASFSLQALNVLSGNHDLGIKYTYRSPSGSALYHANILLRVNIPMSTNLNDIGSATPDNGSYTYLDKGYISASVPLSVTSVVVNGVEAELFTELGNKRFFLMGSPLNVGENAITLEARGEAYDNGDTSAVGTKTIYIIRRDGYDLHFIIPTRNLVFKVTMPPTFTAEDACGFFGCITFENNNTTKLDLVNTDASPSSVLYDGLNPCRYKDENAIYQNGCRELTYSLNFSLQEPTPSGTYYDAVVINKNRKYPLRIPITVWSYETIGLPIIVESNPVANSTIPSTYTPITIEVSDDSAAEVTINGIAANHRSSNMHLYTADVPLVNGLNTITVTAFSFYGQFLTSDPVIGGPLIDLSTGLPYDPADYTATYTYNINVAEQLPPTAIITSHNNGDTVTINPVTITATVSDPSRVYELVVDGLVKGEAIITGDTATWENVLLSSSDGSKQIQVFDNYYSSPISDFVINLVNPPEPLVNITSHQEGSIYVTQNEIVKEPSLVNHRAVGSSIITVTGTVDDPNASVTINGEPVVVTPNGSGAEFSTDILMQFGADRTITVEAIGATSLTDSQTVNFGFAEISIPINSSLSYQDSITMTDQEYRKADSLYMFISNVSSLYYSQVMDSLDTITAEPYWVVNFTVNSTDLVNPGIETLPVNYYIRNTKDDYFAYYGYDLVVHNVP